MTNAIRKSRLSQAVRKIDAAMLAYRSAIDLVKTIVPWDGSTHILYADHCDGALGSMDRLKSRALAELRS